MRIASYQKDGQRHVGLIDVEGQSIAPLRLDAAQRAKGVLSIVEALAEGAGPPVADGAVLALSSVVLEAPFPRPYRGLFCVGRNYRAHAEELSGSVFKNNHADVAAWPIVFTKAPECVVGPQADVGLPHGISEQIDYEAELAVVIGRGGKNIAKEDAMRHVFGYTVINDVTARDVQMRHGQWDLGKSFDTFCPMGPWVVTADEFDGADAWLRCWVNGELRQEAHTTDLIFDIPALIETCSRGITLYPGDIIATGTPAGVGHGLKPPRYLKAGDIVRIEIEGLGVIENRFF